MGLFSSRRSTTNLSSFTDARNIDERLAAADGGVAVRGQGNVVEITDARAIEAARDVSLDLLEAAQTGGNNALATAAIGMQAASDLARMGFDFAVRVNDTAAAERAGVLAPPDRPAQAGSANGSSWLLLAAAAAAVALAGGFA